MSPIKEPISNSVADDNSSPLSELSEMDTPSKPDSIHKACTAPAPEPTAPASSAIVSGDEPVINPKTGLPFHCREPNCQLSGKDFRPVVSHHFGRNKTASKEIGRRDYYEHWCRKHYQQLAYKGTKTDDQSFRPDMTTYCIKKVDYFLNPTLDAIEKGQPGIKFEILLKKSEEVRRSKQIAPKRSSEADKGRPGSGKKRTKATKAIKADAGEESEDAKRAPGAYEAPLKVLDELHLNGMLGKNKTVNDCKAVVAWMLKKVKEGDCDDFVCVEFLPEFDHFLCLEEPIGEPKKEKKAVKVPKKTGPKPKKDESSPGKSKVPAADADSEPVAASSSKTKVGGEKTSSSKKAAKPSKKGNQKPKKDSSDPKHEVEHGDLALAPSGKNKVNGNQASSKKDEVASSTDVDGEAGAASIAETTSEAVHIAEEHEVSFAMEVDSEPDAGMTEENPVPGEEITTAMQHDPVAAKDISTPVEENTSAMDVDGEAMAEDVLSLRDKTKANTNGGSADTTLMPPPSLTHLKSNIASTTTVTAESSSDTLSDSALMPPPPSHACKAAAATTTNKAKSAKTWKASKASKSKKRKRSDDDDTDESSEEDIRKRVKKMIPWSNTRIGQGRPEDAKLARTAMFKHYADIDTDMKITYDEKDRVNLEKWKTDYEEAEKNKRPVPLKPEPVPRNYFGPTVGVNNPHGLAGLSHKASAF
ncbi:hypothetical protein K402DRAFT_263475 [Aulographum hederae CBS 113979]|uniref:Uncharacterized protein n=1 Tax=Aulographum hederae CBS 113979 TaxID=1176131 RepID=A0A6G1HA03_9PEZI|nr:hypothetical protein K402DRAFT_263475 [Aulographum hederae CBS 113979]